MKSDRYLVAFESLATVVMLVVWVAVAIEVEGALRTGTPVPLAAGDAGPPRPVHAAASGSAAGPSGIEPAREPGRGGGDDVGRSLSSLSSTHRRDLPGMPVR